MAITIRTSIPAREAQKAPAGTTQTLNASFAKLSSGSRSVRVADDAAGLAISESISTQIRAFTVAERDAQDAVGMLRTADGALAQVQSILERLHELATRGASGSLTSADRGVLATELEALGSELSRIEGSATFNGRPLLGATVSTIQLGVEGTGSDPLTLSFGGVDLTALVSVSHQVTGAGAAGAQQAVGIIEQTLSHVSERRADYGATLTRLDVTVSTLETMRLNFSAASSRIRDVDVATETAKLTQDQVLSQAGVSVRAQASQLPQLGLNLLQ